MLVLEAEALVCEKNPSSIPDSAVRDLLVFQQLHEVVARHIQQICCLLGGELGMDWRNGHCVAVGDLGQHIYEEPQRFAGDLKGCVVVISSKLDGGADKVGAVSQELVERGDSFSSLGNGRLIRNIQFVVKHSRQQKGLLPRMGDI